MASKGKTFKSYDLSFKQKVLNEYRTGISGGYLSQKYDIPLGTIKSWNLSKLESSMMRKTLSSS